mmetsp:Transcript_543/g.1704  ORF Transcript_543/g.1704 Transcript_543/m.1704 type:complete len:207 (-) Transcript_543:2226-2846(-)
MNSHRTRTRRHSSRRWRCKIASSKSSAINCPGSARAPGLNTEYAESSPFRRAPPRLVNMSANPVHKTYIGPTSCVLAQRNPINHNVTRNTGARAIKFAIQRERPKRATNACSTRARVPLKGSHNSASSSSSSAYTPSSFSLSSTITPFTIRRRRRRCSVPLADAPLAARPRARGFTATNTAAPTPSPPPSSRASTTASTSRNTTPR